jgi:Rne/Rng family ribonuclease
MDVLIEDLEGSLWAVAIDKENKIQNIEIDPYSEIIRWGSIYMGRVSRIDAGQDAAFIDLGHGFEGILYLKHVRLDGKPAPKGKKIGQVLSAGDIVMVQVKTPYNAQAETESEIKLSQLSMDIAIQGRYLIYTPFAAQNRISKRISNPELRKSLKSMMKELTDMEGCILRSSAAHCQTEVLRRESKILKAIWSNLLEFDGEQEATLLMLGPDAVQRLLSDNSDRGLNKINVATMDIFEDTEEWCDLYAPDLMTKIEPKAAENTRTGMGLFEIYDLIGQFERLLKPYVVLASGGSIIIEETAAMTVIDVNKGADKSAANANHEAAIELARQIRLRNLGGIIMADFINMKKAEQGRLLKTLEQAFDNDPCTAQCHGVTELGVFEISRQRRTPTLAEKLLMFEADGSESE